MKKLLHLLLLPLIATIIVSTNTSCSDDDNCSIAGRSMVNCLLYKINPETNVRYRDTLTSLTITALGTDSIIINNQTNVMDFSLPLRYTSDSTILVLHYDEDEFPGITDTLYFIQNNTPFFESMKCGYTMTQIITDLTYTKHQIDSIYIRNTNANTDGTENLQIFYRFDN